MDTLIVMVLGSQVLGSPRMSVSLADGADLAKLGGPSTTPSLAPPGSSQGLDS